MKKKITALLLTGIMFAITACGNTAPVIEEQQDTKKEAEIENTESNVSDSGEEPETESAETVEVDEGLFDVEITVPAGFIKESTQEELDALCEENGFKSIVLNSDGSATYTMTKKQHKELMEEQREVINNTLNDMIGSEDYPNITNIEANDNFTEFTVTTKNTELDMAESFSVIIFYMSGGMYHAFSGEEVENISVTFVNAETGAIIHTANSSDTK